MTKADKIVIRPQMIKDANDFFRILTNGRFEFFPVNVSSLEAEKRLLRSNRNSFKTGESYNFSILLNNKVIGAIGVLPERNRPYNAEIGYFLDKDQHGKGYALQAVRLAETYVLKHLPVIHRLYAVIVVENLPSIRVVEKAGYEKEGMLRKYLLVGDKFLDACIFSKILR
ncbi:MAG: GNAT family N-acetyltransferase [Candidatus Rifleibacteriota bacterium]